MHDGQPVFAKGRLVLAPGERLTIELPGGGGWGDPRRRDPERVASDVADGLVSREAAEREYGVALKDDGTVDEETTRRLRAV
jgi:N-methylhydantoinase B